MSIEESEIPAGREVERVCGVRGEVTSRVIHFPPLRSKSAVSEGVCDGLRELAITVWPAERARWARVRPKPEGEEQPVMSQVSLLGGEVEEFVVVEDIFELWREIGESVGEF